MNRGNIFDEQSNSSNHNEEKKSYRDQIRERHLNRGKIFAYFSK